MKKCILARSSRHENTSSARVTLRCRGIVSGGHNSGLFEAIPASMGNLSFDSQAHIITQNPVMQGKNILFFLMDMLNLQAVDHDFTVGIGLVALARVRLCVAPRLEVASIS